MLVSALVNALVYGRDVVVLTDDPLVMDQFAKLTYLIRQHYLALQFADCLANEPERVAFEESDGAGLPPSLPQTAFLGDIKTAMVPRGDLQSILPASPLAINIHCWLHELDDSESSRVSVMSFCGERPMLRVLQAKACAGENNTDQPKAPHVCVEALAGVNWPQEFAVVAACDRLTQLGSHNFPKDERLELTQNQYAVIDLVHVINRGITPDVPSILGSS